MMRRIEAAIGIVLLAIIAFAGYRLARSKVEIDVYRDRLAGLVEEYEDLRLLYNEAVTRTAVTELLVEDGRLSLAIRTIEGVDRLIETPFDPSREIYCDYVLVNGRIWIRRVYDDRTPPSEGLLVDEGLRHVSWDDPTARYGKAIYRSLDAGRWIVTVSGDGSLGLAKTDPAAEITLVAAPPVRDFEVIEAQIGRRLTDVTASQVVRRALSGR